MTQTAFDSRFPNEKRAEFRKIILNHIDRFRISFSSGPSTTLLPLTIDLTPNATPARVELQNFSRGQREFLSCFVTNLVECGMAYSNLTSPWGSALSLVQKPDLFSFSYTVCLRIVNMLTIKHRRSILKVQTFLHNGDFDAVYWHHFFLKSSQVSQSFITHNGIFSLTRVLHGSTNAISHLEFSSGKSLSTDLKTLYSAGSMTSSVMAKLMIKLSCDFINFSLSVWDWISDYTQKNAFFTQHTLTGAILSSLLMESDLIFN